MIRFVVNYSRHPHIYEALVLRARNLTISLINIIKGKDHENVSLKLYSNTNLLYYFWSQLVPGQHRTNLFSVT
jgi:hypothetical protein